MSRSARKISQTGIYHVVMRGINHQRIFRDHGDYEYLLSLLYQLTNTDKCCNIYAYALMSNHFHLLVDIPKDTEVGIVIKRIAAKYVLHFNQCHGRDGHLFKERFKSEPCEDETYFITLLRYIHQNPLKAGMVNRVEDYEFTSWSEYISDIPYDKRICNTSLPLGIIDKNSLIELVNSPLEDAGCIECVDEDRKNLSDIDIANYLVTQHNISAPFALQNLDTPQRDEILSALLNLGAGVRQLQRLTGIGKNIISRLSQKR